MFLQNVITGYRLPRRDILIVMGGVVSILLASWAYMGYMAWAMSHMHLVDMWMPPVATSQWAAWDFFMLFLMWTVMMVAMMVPSVIPMVLMFAAVNRNRQAGGQAHVSTLIFISGYLIAWTAYSLLASLAQWPLHTSGFFNPMMESNSYRLSGAVLIAAGLYQWTPLKDACLNQCRSPLGFIMTQWRDGRLGALRMGIHHGLFCVGCCWGLMLVLFAVGVMNMLWVLLLAALVLLEKLLPAPRLMRMTTGAALVIWGVFWLLSG